MYVEVVGCVWALLPDRWWGGFCCCCGPVANVLKCDRICHLAKLSHCVAHISHLQPNSEKTTRLPLPVVASLRSPLSSTMSNFASLLNSFKQNAASASRATKTSRDGSSAATAAHDEQLSSKKRPRPSSGTSQAPHFPAFHSSPSQKKKGSFELSFLVIGGQKCGTTWLHTMLQKCKQLSLPNQKEVHFWDWHYKKGFDWYTRQFGYPDYNTTNANTKQPLYGEITPDYVVLGSSTIAEIHRCFPDLKVVFVARDLVDRAWSAMIMELRDQNMGLNAGEFADGVIGGKDSKRAKTASVSTAQQRRMRQLSSPSSQPDSYYLDRLRNTTHNSRSDYATSLNHWYEHFPTDSILLIDYNEIKANPRGLLEKIAMHIGVDEVIAKQYVNDLDDEEVRQRVNAAAKRDSKDGDSSSSLSQRPRLKKQLESHLRPYTMEFNTLLKNKGYSWTLNDYSQEK